MSCEQLQMRINIIPYLYSKSNIKCSKKSIPISKENHKGKAISDSRPNKFFKKTKWFTYSHKKQNFDANEQNQNSMQNSYNSDFISCIIRNVFISNTPCFCCICGKSSIYLLLLIDIVSDYSSWHKVLMR